MLIGNELVDHLLEVGPYFKEIFGKDVIVWISDTDRILGYFAGDNFDIPSDGILAADDPMRIAMNKRKTMHTNIPKDMFGIPFKEIDNPIFDCKNNVVGCITIGISLDQEQKVANLANHINEAVDNIDTSVQEFTSSAENIRNAERVLRDNITEVNQLTKQIAKVLNFTKKITVQTNLLSLNAAIEAARAGAYGVGFGVVADEIRKLSDDTLETAKKIESLISQINMANSITLENSELACIATEEQVAETKKTKTKIAELKSISEELKAISKEI